MSRKSNYQMAVKLVVLKSDEHLIADVKEIRNQSDDVVGYYFNDPLILDLYSTEEECLLLEDQKEEGKTNELQSKVGITFYPWIPLAAERNIPCSADWVVTIVEPRDNLKTLYEGRKNGKQDDQGSIVINE